ncbi:MAG: hypothetical protein JRD89_05215 [Deltaproteobacteria bacterium]|nr:hypothetical protein [Deltaproteobacteria bacterium]
MKKGYVLLVSIVLLWLGAFKVSVSVEITSLKDLLTGTALLIAGIAGIAYLIWGGKKEEVGEPWKHGYS